MIAATDAGTKTAGPRVMSARDLGAESTDDLLTTSDTPARAVPADDVTDAPASAEASVQEIGQQPMALNTPSLNTIIEQAVGNTPTAVAPAGLGIPDFLSPGVSSISGIFGGIALGGLAAGGGGGSAGIFSAAGVGSSVLGGRLVNGYISGARVYQDQDNDGVFDYDDANGNGSFDDGEELEPYALTSADGSYELTIVTGGGSLIAEPLAGTVDQSTGATVTSQFSAPSGATVISPVSTLVEAGLSESQVKNALGIDSSIDILNFDPVSETLYGDDPDKALGFKSASVLVSNLLDVGSEIIAGAAGSTDNFSDQVVSGIVGLIRESGSAAVDFSDADTVGSALTKAANAAQSSGVAIDPSASSFTDTVTGMQAQIATANAAVKTALTDNAGDPAAALLQIAKIEAATQTTLSDKARGVANGTDTVESLGSFDLDGAIEAASVPDVIRAYVSATSPSRGESGVISVYSDAYTDVSASWTVPAGQETIIDEAIVTGSGDSSKKVPGMDSVTVSLSDTLDASEMSALFASIWRSEPDADLSITLVDYGGDGVFGTDDDSQHVVTYGDENGNTIDGGQWTDIKIDLGDLTELDSTGNIGEIIFSSREDGGASDELLYIDNLYFGKSFGGFSFDEPQWSDPLSGWSKTGIQQAYIPSVVEQEDGNNVLGFLKIGDLAHVRLGTGRTDAGAIIDPIDLNTNPVLAMWVHTETAGSTFRIELGDSASGGWPNDQKYTTAAATAKKAGWNYLTFDFDSPIERFVANGADNGSRGYTNATRFDANTSYDILAIFPDLQVPSARGRVYFFDELAPYTGESPPEPLAVTGGNGGNSLPAFSGLAFEGAEEGYNLLGFQGAEGQVVLAPDPENPDNTVIQFTKTADAFHYAGVQLGLDGTKTVGPINFDIAGGLTAITARIWVPQDRLDDNGGSIVARMEVGDSLFDGYDLNYVMAETELTQAGWNDVLFDFASPVERYVSVDNAARYTGLSDDLTYDRIAVFLDWEIGKGLIPPNPIEEDSPYVYYIDEISDVVGGLTGGYTVPDGYVLAFEDNFDDIDQGPDSNFWTYDLGDGTDQGIPGWGNNELQVYQNDSDDVRIVDVGVSEGDTDGNDDGINGALRITAKRDGDTITSARVKSDIDYLPAYGYYEIRAKLPSRDGAWPAIWLLGDTESGTWPAVGEIDMVEWSSQYAGDSDVRISHALHATDFSGGAAKKWEGDIGSRIDDWHVYQLWWTPDTIKMGVDGGVLDAHLTYNKPSGASDANWPYDDPMDIIMNVAIGGDLGGTEKVPSGSFNYDMYVDYVRVYQEAPVPTSGPDEPVAPPDGFISVLDEDNVSSWRSDDSINSTFNHLDLGGNTVRQYSDVTRFTIEPSSALDVSGAYTFQFSIYRTDPYADLKVKLVNGGPGDESEHELVFSGSEGSGIDSGQWVRVEVPTSTLTSLNGLSEITQIVIYSQKNVDGVLVGSGETIYLDDILFSPPPVPDQAPPLPDDPASYVISLYSDQEGFTDLVSTSWSSDTDLTALEPDLQLNSGTNPVKHYTDVDFIEIEPAAPIDVSLMESLKLDVWRTKDTADLKLKLVDFGTDGAPGGAVDAEYEWILSSANGYPANQVGSWTHIDIPLSDMGVAPGANIGQIVISSHDTGPTSGAGETLYLDNIYFSRPPPPIDINFEEDDGSGFDLADAQANLDGASSLLTGNFLTEMPGNTAYLQGDNSQKYFGVSRLLELEEGESLVSEDNGIVTIKTYAFEDNVRVTLRLEEVLDLDDDEMIDFVEVTATTGASETVSNLSFDFSTADGWADSKQYGKASIFFEATAQFVIFDDIQFNGAVLGE